MPERFNLGQLLVIVGAATLLVSLFIDWYEPGLSAWEIFEVGDVILAGLAIVALATALPMRLPETGATLAAERSLAWIGAAALIFVVVALLNDPPAARDLPLEFGAWLGLVGAALMAAGGFLSKAQISIVISSRPAGAKPPAAPPVPPPGTAAPPPPQPLPTKQVGSKDDTATRPPGSDEPSSRP